MTIEIDTTTEKLVTLAVAARDMPGGPVHVATLHRWRMRGIRGIQLPTVLRGGIRHTSMEAVHRWIQATTAVGNGQCMPSRTCNQREKAIAAAEANLAKNGI